MSAGNGAAVVRALFVAELGSEAGPGEFGAMAKCTRCLPTWTGPQYRLSVLLIHEPTLERPQAVAKLRDLAVIDVLRHADRAHHGNHR